MDRFEGEGAIQAFWLYSLGTLQFPRPHGGPIDYATELDLEFTPDFGSDHRPRLYVSNKIRKSEKGFDQVDGELNCVDARGVAYPDCLDREGRSILGERWAYLAIRISASEVEYAFLAPETVDGRMALWGGGPDAWPNTDTFSLGPPVHAVWGEFMKLDNPAYLPSRDMVSIFTLTYSRADDKPLGKTYRMLADWYLFSPCPSLSIDDGVSIAESFQARGIRRVNTTNYPKEVEEPAPETPHTAEIVGPLELDYGEEGTWTIRASIRGTTFVTSYRYRWIGMEGIPGPWIAVYAPSITLSASHGHSGIEIQASLLDYWFPNGAGAPNNHRTVSRRSVSFTR